MSWPADRKGMGRNRIPGLLMSTSMAATEFENKEVDKRAVETSARASDGIFMAKYVYYFRYQI